MSGRSDRKESAKLGHRREAVRRHDLDSALFQDRYSLTQHGKYTDAFVYGRTQILDEIERDLDVIPADASVLDIGSGTGHITGMVASPTRTVVGLEPSEEMRRLAHTNFPDIEFVDGISARLPFDDDSFDYVIAVEVLRYLHPDDVLQTYREIRRVLRPGGRCLITHVNRYAADGYFFYYNLMRSWRRLMGRPYHHCYFTTGAEECSRAGEAGFEASQVCGRMLAPIRIGYKLGRRLGSGFAKLLELGGGSQRFSGGLGLNTSGHLIFRGHLPTDQASR
jgi:SAM-dependent methyltransferase